MLGAKNERPPAAANGRGIVKTIEARLKSHFTPPHRITPQAQILNQEVL